MYANEADFNAANDVFTLLNGTAGGQESKMTKKESDLLAIIEKADLPEFTIQDLQRFTGGSYMGIYRMIKGYDSRGKNYTGLLEKCPALSFTDRTVTMNEDEGVFGPAQDRGVHMEPRDLPAVDEWRGLLARSRSEGWRWRFVCCVAEYLYLQLCCNCSK